MRRRPRFVIAHVTYKPLWYPYIDCLWNKLPVLGMTDSDMVELSTLLCEMLLAPTTQVILKNGFHGRALEVGIGAIVRQPPMIHKAYSEAEQSLYHGALRLVVPQLEIANRLPIFNVANAQVPLTSLPRLAETAATLDQMTYAGVNELAFFC